MTSLGTMMKGRVVSANVEWTQNPSNVQIKLIYYHKIIPFPVFPVVLLETALLMTGRTAETVPKLATLPILADGKILIFVISLFEIESTVCFGAAEEK